MYSSACIISSIVHTANIEIRECVMWSLTRGERLWKIIKLSSLKGGRGRLQEVAVY